MVDQARRKPRTSGQRPKLPLYFHLNGQLHKRLFINRGKDMVETHNFATKQRMTYNYSDVLKRYVPTFSTQEAADMLSRRVLVLHRAILDGMIEPPQRSYTLDGQYLPRGYRWAEVDILRMLDFLSTVHIGRPRKDGRINPGYLPSPREIRAMTRTEGEALYVKSGDTFVPTWRAKEW